MFYVQSTVHIADNSGGFIGMCVRVLGQNYRAAAGDAVVIAIKAIILNKKITHRRKRKVLKGTVRQAIVLRTGSKKRRAFNVFVKGSSNAVAILGNWGMPLATRAYGPGQYELKTSKFPKFANICEGVY